MVNIDDPSLDLLRLVHHSFTKRFDVLQTASRSLKDGLGHEIVSVAHELLILADLLVEKIWEDVTSDDLILFPSDWRNRGFCLCSQLPVRLDGTESKSATCSVQNSIVTMTGVERLVIGVVVLTDVITVVASVATGIGVAVVILLTSVMTMLVNVVTDLGFNWMWLLLLLILVHVKNKFIKF